MFKGRLGLQGTGRDMYSASSCYLHWSEECVGLKSGSEGERDYNKKYQHS